MRLQEKGRVPGTVVEKVLPNKEGAGIGFAPNVLYSVEGESETTETGSRASFHTICMVCKVRNSACHWVVQEKGG